MAPAAAAPIAGCPRGRAAAAPPFILYTKGPGRVNGWLARCRSLNTESLVAYGTSQGTTAGELLVGPSGAQCFGARCSVQLALLLGFRPPLIGPQFPHAAGAPAVNPEKRPEKLPVRSCFHCQK